MEDRRKSKEVSEWLSHNIKKTKFHSIVETEVSPAQGQIEAMKKRQELIEQKEAYAKIVQQMYKPRASEVLVA